MRQLGKAQRFDYEGKNGDKFFWKRSSRFRIELALCSANFAQFLALYELGDSYRRTCKSSIALNSSARYTRQRANRAERHGCKLRFLVSGFS